MLAAYFDPQPHEFTESDGTRRPHYRKCSELPWLLEQTSQWGALTDLLADSRFFSAAYTVNRYDLYRYWARLEGEGHSRCTEAYRGVLESAADHEEGLLWDLANFLQERGDLELAAGLRNHQVGHYHQGEAPEDPCKLAIVLCARARDEVARGDVSTARADLDRAEQIAAQRQLGRSPCAGVGWPRPDVCLS